MTDEPQPEYCDCPGFHDGSCRTRHVADWELPQLPPVGSLALWVHCSDNYKALIPCVVVEITTRIKIAVRRPNNNISFRYVGRDELVSHLSASFLIALDCEAIHSRLKAAARIP